jgi:hypothetical protein
MGFLSFTIAMFAFALETTLVWRARQGEFLSRFPLFYSYVVFVFLTNLVGIVVFYRLPQSYPNVFWFDFTAMLVVEFAVLLEASDHIFESYPLIRRLGRFLTACICLFFFVVYVIPPFMQPRSPRAAIFDFVKRTSLTKAVLILVLLAAARLFHVSLERHVAGILLGFATYLSLNIANITLAEQYTPIGYAPVFAVVGPISFVLALGIWNLALWRYEPILPDGREILGDYEKNPEPVGRRLGRFNSELIRLLRR